MAESEASSSGEEASSGDATATSSEAEAMSDKLGHRWQNREDLHTMSDTQERKKDSKGSRPR